jgi:hypothetical protein
VNFFCRERLDGFRFAGSSFAAMMRTASQSLLFFVLLAACGGGAHQTTPDESADFGSTAGGMTRRIVDMPVGLDATEWQWIEAHCTEGPLDLASRGFSQRLRIREDDTSLLLVYDQQFANENCSQTVVQRVSPPAEPGELLMEEVTRVTVPSTEACGVRPELPRPGEVRRQGSLLEVLVQRSNWCGGFEVRMVYAPATPQLLVEDEIARHYAAEYTRGDFQAVARLFAETGSLLEPFTETATGDPYRHDGRTAVEAWYQAAFSETPWRAMRIVSMEPGAEPHTMVVEWEHMDPRLSEPLRGRTRFTVAAGEIFEARIELLSAPELAPSGEEAAPPPS